VKAGRVYAQIPIASTVTILCMEIERYFINGVLPMPDVHGFCLYGPIAVAVMSVRKFDCAS
jgi:hypothetical protein